MKKIISVSLVLFILSCVNQQTKIIDAEHKSFFVNGVSALDGYEAVANSLVDMGFMMDEGGVTECDLSSVGMGFTYYVNYHADKLNKEQASRLTCGLFDKLPSGINYYEEGKWRVYLQWYRSGEVKKCLITFNEFMPLKDEDAIEVNKRLSTLFPHSKIGNSTYGYKTYYDDNGVEFYFQNSITIELEKK